MTKTRVCFFIFCVWVVISIFCNDCTNSKPIQILNNKPGYIAVYIRHGNEPLVDINPSLAEAFHEQNDQNGVIPLSEHHSPTIKDTVGTVEQDNSQNLEDKKDVTAQPYTVSQN